MNRRTLLNVVLFALAIGLASFLHLRPAEQARTEHGVSAAKAGTARALAIERPGHAALALERRDAGWFLTAPARGRADPLKVERILEVLGAKSATRLPREGLERFDLDRPAAVLTVDGETFAFGGGNPVTREQYLATGDAVYLVSPRYFAALPSRAGDVLARDLFGPGEVPVSFRLEGYTVREENGRWAVEPAAPDLGQDDLARWAQEWKVARALVSAPANAAPQGAKLVVGLRDGREIELAIRAREPEMAFVRTDEGIEYRFPGDVAKRMLSPPKAGR